jgi:hypothetical protein
MAVTSKRVAKIASKLLKSKRSTRKVKTVSASDLRQREKKRK